MTLKTLQTTYIYSFNYDYHLKELCKLEARQLFNKEEKNKLLFSKIKIDPSISTFIKSRLEIVVSSENFSELLKEIKKENIRMDGFTAEYLILDEDHTQRTERRQKLKDVGYSIDGLPDFKTPTITYSICTYESSWYFGILTKQDNGCYKHKKKPHSFSNSLGMDIAKTLVSIASKGNKANKLLDACCGVGTIMLEARFCNFDIEGCDISSQAAKYTRQNLAYYDYTANVYCSDIKDLDKQYDAAIIDLPYNLYSFSDDSITTNIIESAARLSSHIVIVSISDIEDTIQKSGLVINDFCTVDKKGKSTFTRKIWVCEIKKGNLH